jgi:hypothetical protein
MITVSKITKWQTSDGIEHSSQEMAHQHILNAEMCRSISEESALLSKDLDAQDIVNWITSHHRQVRALLEACDAMEKASSR